MTSNADLPYRPCAGAMILSRDGQVFVGKRIDSTLDAWQMPQGGIDPGEDALPAAIREVGEETGIDPALIKLVAEAPEELYYDLPEELIGKLWKGKWRGQRQRWFLFEFLGEDSDVDIATGHPEFSAWKWAYPADITGMIVPFKKRLYEDVLAAFSDHLSAPSLRSS